MFRYLVLLLVASKAFAFMYTGPGQSFDEQGSRSYKVGLDIMPGIYGDHYQFVQIDSEGMATVTDCFVIRAFPLHQRARNRFIVLAPAELSSCAELDSYQTVGWGSSWDDDDKKSLLMTIVGSRGQRVLEITEQSLTIEIVGFKVEMEASEELSLSRYWREEYQLIIHRQ